MKPTQEVAAVICRALAESETVEAAFEFAEAYPGQSVFRTLSTQPAVQARSDAKQRAEQLLLAKLVDEEKLIEACGEAGVESRAFLIRVLARSQKVSGARIDRRRAVSDFLEEHVPVAAVALQLGIDPREAGRAHERANNRVGTLRYYESIWQDRQHSSEVRAAARRGWAVVRREHIEALQKQQRRPMKRDWDRFKKQVARWGLDPDNLDAGAPLAGIPHPLPRALATRPPSASPPEPPPVSAATSPPKAEWSAMLEHGEMSFDVAWDTRRKRLAVSEEQSGLTFYVRATTNDIVLVDDELTSEGPAGEWSVQPWGLGVELTEEASGVRIVLTCGGDELMDEGLL